MMFVFMFWELLSKIINVKVFSYLGKYEIWMIDTEIL